MKFVVHIYSCTSSTRKLVDKYNYEWSNWSVVCKFFEARGYKQVGPSNICDRWFQVSINDVEGHRVLIHVVWPYRERKVKRRNSGKC